MSSKQVHTVVVYKSAYNHVVDTQFSNILSSFLAINLAMEGILLPNP